MYKALAWQIRAGFLVVIGAGVLLGSNALVSAGLAAFAVILPNSFLVLRLSRCRSDSSGADFISRFYIGEFLRVVATLALLGIAVAVYPTMHWLSFLLALVVTLHAGFLAFWEK